MNNQVKTTAGMVLSIMTGTLIMLFLFGNIIEIPHGTHKGGLIAAFGVAVILFFVGILSIVIAKMLTNTNKGNIPR
jgi:mannitol/fructose-specific phosphotransferase system IIA component